MWPMIVWACFALAILVSLARPWLGIVAYYSFVFLQPKWNWFYAIPREVSFERYIIIAVLVGGLLRCRSIPAVHPYIKVGLAGFITWILVALLGTYRAFDPVLSSFIFGSLWKIALVAGLSTLAFTAPARITTLLRISTVASLYSSFRITKEYLEIGYCRYIYDGWGWGTGSNQASMIFTGLAMIAMCLMLYDKNNLWRMVAFVGFSLHMHAIMLLESRSCMLGAVIAIAFVCLVAPKTKQNLSILIAGFVVGAVLAGPSVINEFNSILPGSDELDVSARSRFDTWNGGISAFRTAPLLGHGPSMSGYEVVKYLPETYREERELRMKNPHNTPIEVLADYGIIGFVGLYGFLGMSALMSVIYLRRKDTTSEEQLAFVAGISGFLSISLASIFSSALLVEVYYMLAALTSAAVNYRWGQQRAAETYANEHFEDEEEDSYTTNPWEEELVSVS